MGFSFDKKQLTDVINGAIILGSGGGGDHEISFKLLDDVMKIAPSVQFVSPGEVPDDAMVTVISGIGSPVATKKRGFDPENCIVAFEKMEKFAGKKVEYVTAFETGGGNFMPPLYVAAKLGLKVVDGDGVGRAVPESQMSQYEICGIAPSPFIIADEFGTTAVLTVKSSADGEKYARIICKEMGGAAGVANYLMTGKQMKSCIVGDTYSRAKTVGEALSVSEDPVKAVTKVLNGFEIIRGKVAEFKCETINAHDFGYQLIEGEGVHLGKRVKIAFENENMLVYDGNGNLLAMTPDLLCVFCPDGTPLTNADIVEGTTVALVVAPCADVWRNAKSFKVFENAYKTYFNFTQGYIPLEKLLKQATK